MITFHPFSESVLNASNSLSESAIFLIFLFIAINLLNIPDYYHDTIDQILQWLLISIMAIQMAASIIVFIRTIYLLIKKKCHKKIFPISYEKDSSSLAKIELTKS